VHRQTFGTGTSYGDKAIKYDCVLARELKADCGNYLEGFGGSHREKETYINAETYEILDAFEDMFYRLLMRDTICFPPIYDEDGKLDETKSSWGNAFGRDSDVLPTGTKAHSAFANGEGMFNKGNDVNKWQAQSYQYGWPRSWHNY
jgi:hypothetical protein